MINQTTKLTKELVELAELNGTLNALYGQEVNRLIRLKYSQSEENSVYRHKLNGTGNDEFATFDAYCEECKAKVDEHMAKLKAELEAAIATEV